MKLTSLWRRALPVSALALLSLLAACSDKTLDFRNAEISNGKIYKINANKPHTGPLTNLPMTQLRLSQSFVQMGKLLPAIRPKQLANAFYFVEVSACDVKVKDGTIADGDIVCRQPGHDRGVELTLKHGVLNGKYLAYAGGGPDNPQISARFKDGKLDGRLKFFDPEGEKLIHQSDWKDGGMHGEEIGYDFETGAVNLRGKHKDGKYDGLIVRYTPDGKKEVHRTSYENGERHGTEIRYTPDGQHELHRISYEKGKPHGTEVRYTPDGKQEVFRASYVGGMPHGVETHFDAVTGKKTAHVDWVDGQRHGKYQQWDSNGKVIGERVFENNVDVTAQRVAPPAEPSGADAALVEKCMDSKIALHRKLLGEDEPLGAEVLGEWEQSCRKYSRF